MFVNERPKKRRKSGKSPTKPENDGCEWEEVRLDSPDIMGIETEWEKHMREANEAEEKRRQQTQMQKAKQVITKIQLPEYEDL
ncbi:hypothetical protein TWF506_008390 [Arthrobotrys conoides]|uniref:Uncharacterized protein n=1 Tax=Arthrobotrys conoides TaxID=74498 RepID=A0AAN8PFN4_9PEZI